MFFEGKIISSEPLNDDASWMCNECEFEVDAMEIKWFNQSLTKEIESLPKSGPKHLELFLNKYEATLHPTNSHILQVKFALVQFYGNARGYSLAGSVYLLEQRQTINLLFICRLRIKQPANSQKNRACRISVRSGVDFGTWKVQNLGPVAARIATCFSNCS